MTDQATQAIKIEDLIAEVAKLGRPAKFRIDVNNIEFFKTACERAFGPFFKAAEPAVNSFAGIPVVENRIIPYGFVAIMENGQIKSLLDLRSLDGGTDHDR